MKRRAQLVRQLRLFFDDQGFIEVDTPIAVPSLAPEPNIEAPQVQLQTPNQTNTRYLQTSPELNMKRLLAHGLPLIYQIAPAFRQNDFTNLHRPEFRLLEWYRYNDNLDALMNDCESLLVTLNKIINDEPILTYQGRKISLVPPFRRISVDDAFRQYAGFSILEALETDILAQHLRKLNIHFIVSESWDDLYNRVFISLIEPKLINTGEPFFLTQFPRPLASLARLAPHDNRVAERFELYIGGIELANAFAELVDADQQRKRFVHDREQRLKAGMHDYPPDEAFFTALATLPPSAGIALGLDRLLMLLLDAIDIDDIAFIPWGN
ncbi:MAG: EF-P lysine aminoacylase GenX [Deltaproteobacteria bacterium]|nr:EF-P lysine aminoacylase GenX [Deltaproteobacteria bacterium]